ncbi:MAG: hypothetical protein QNJ54_17765 [Prochloraceae cyanobacterium]|nr:hypothetical protein [Prochloraceae cyanobacterium]
MAAKVNIFVKIKIVRSLIEISYKSGKSENISFDVFWNLDFTSCIKLCKKLWRAIGVKQQFPRASPYLKTIAIANLL